MLSSEADRFAANILPIIRAVRSSGATSLAAVVQILNDRGIRTAPAPTRSSPFTCSARYVKP